MQLYSLLMDCVVAVAVNAIISMDLESKFRKVLISKMLYGNFLPWKINKFEMDGEITHISYHIWTQCALSMTNATNVVFALCSMSQKNFLLLSIHSGDIYTVVYLNSEQIG